MRLQPATAEGYLFEGEIAGRRYEFRQEARQFGVSTALVCLICNGEVWRHLG
jgi:hypothetical protein